MAESFVLDRRAILERLGGDEEIYAIMVDMFLQDFERNCLAIATAFTAGDVSAVQREAHTIKGLLATFSDDGGAADAMLIERQAKAGDISGLAEPIAAIQQRMHEVATVLRG